jgi:hypothetical protein
LIRLPSSPDASFPASRNRLPTLHDQITKAGGAYCSTFGLEDVTAGYSEFLGYFMPRKVMCGKETMRAAGTVTKKLAT